MNLAAITRKIYKLTKTNATSYPNSDIADDLAIANNHITSLIYMADGRWEWEDANQSDLPVATAALVANQQDYSLVANQLYIERIEVLPNGGSFFYKLTPRDVTDPMWGSEFNGIDTTTKGAPMYYDVRGNSLFLYPTPNYSQAASLKIYFKRAQVDFVTSDIVTGTLVPGFVSTSHDLLAYLVAYDYAIINLPALANGYQAVIQKKEAELKMYYTQRNIDDGPRLSMKQIIYK